LENERYLGEKEYPPILEPEDFLRAQLVRGEKNTYTPCPDYIRPIREKAVCGVCGGRMLRDTRAGGKPRWYCEKEGCTNRRYIEDEDIRTALSERLNVLAQNPNLLDWLLPQNTNESTLEAVRIRNEVIRELNKAEPGAEYTKMLILACAAEQYSGLPDSMPYDQMQRLKEKILTQSINEELLRELFTTAVQEIQFTAHGGLRLRLINGKSLEADGKEDAKCPKAQ
ncbi:MAG: zinc ribbon domain-containing protein, partial [Oscillospiraceae bacterium]